MKKYIILTFSLMFLSACGQTSQDAPTSNTQTNTVNISSSTTQPEPAVLSGSLGDEANF